MGTKFLEVMCDENGIGGSGDYCGDNDAHLCRINVYYHEAMGGKYAPPPRGPLRPRARLDRRCRPN
jgi:tubulin beta